VFQLHAYCTTDNKVHLKTTNIGRNFAATDDKMKDKNTKKTLVIRK